MRKLFASKQEPPRSSAAQALQDSSVSVSDAERSGRVLQIRSEVGRSSSIHGILGRRDVLQSKRQHWCPAAEPGGSRCSTPPSCDENSSVREQNSLNLGPCLRVIAAEGIGNEQTSEIAKKSRFKSYARRVNIDPPVAGLNIEASVAFSSRASSTSAPPSRSHTALESSGSCTSRTSSSNYRVEDNGRLRISSPRGSDAKHLGLHAGCEHPIRRQKSGLPPVTIRYCRPISHTLNEGPSIMLQPKSYSFSQAYRDKSFGVRQKISMDLAECLSSDKSPENRIQKHQGSSVTNEKSHFRFLSARAVAERLAKAIRGSSRSSPSDAKSSPQVQVLSNRFQLEEKLVSKEFQESHCYEQSFQNDSYFSDSDRNPEDVSTCSEITSEIYRPDTAVKKGVHDTLDTLESACRKVNKQEGRHFLVKSKHISHADSDKGSSIKPPVNSTGLDKKSSQECDKVEILIPYKKYEADQERDLVNGRLESYINYFSPSNEDSEKKAWGTQELAGNLELDIREGEDLPWRHDRVLSSKAKCSMPATGELYMLQPKIRELHQDEGRLNPEVAAGLQLQIVERDSAKQVMGLMQTAVDLHVEVSEREEQELFSCLEKELEFEKVENKKLRQTISILEEEKAGLENELTQGSVLGDKIKSFELLMRRHTNRLEEAEKINLHLRQAFLNAQKQQKEAEEELQTLITMSKEKEGQNVALRRSLIGVRHLNLDHEDQNSQVAFSCSKKSTSDREYSRDRSPMQLQQELMRINNVEKALQGELHALQVEADSLSWHLKSLEEKLKSKEGMAFMLKSNLAIDSLKSKTLFLQNVNSRSAKKIWAALEDDIHVTQASETPKVENEGAKLLNERLAAGLFDAKTNFCGRVEAFEDFRFNMIKASDCEIDLLQECTEGKAEVLGVYNSENHEIVRSREQLKDRVVGRTSPFNLGQARGSVQWENTLLRSHLSNVNRRFAQLENKLKEKEEKMKVLEESKAESLLEISRLRKERDEFWKEAEEFGREALRTSAQVEIWRRKADQLEEEVLLKEGQISILKESFEAFD